MNMNMDFDIGIDTDSHTDMDTDMDMGNVHIHVHVHVLHELCHASVNGHSFNHLTGQTNRSYFLKVTFPALLIPFKRARDSSTGGAAERPGGGGGQQDQPLCLKGLSSET